MGYHRNRKWQPSEKNPTNAQVNKELPNLANIVPPPPPPKKKDNVGYLIDPIAALRNTVEFPAPSGWNWDLWTVWQKTSVRVSLQSSGVRDHDLQSLVHYLSAWLEYCLMLNPKGLDLTLDLSCNPGISDYGITTYLVPFLRSWPACRRLRLYQTSIGDQGIQALAPWISGGEARELHLSDLQEEVTDAAVLDLLRGIHSGGNYPYKKPNGGRAPLWLRLEHNRLQDVDDILAKAEADGVHCRVLDQKELSHIRPGDDLVWKKIGKENPEVILVLFRSQQRKHFAQDTLLQDSKDILQLIRATPPAAAAAEGDAVERVFSEPVMLSTDEMCLVQAEERWSQEGGADSSNADTFQGVETAAWSFEDIVRANERLQTQPEGGKKGSDNKIDIEKTFSPQCRWIPDQFDPIAEDRRRRRADSGSTTQDSARSAHTQPGLEHFLAAPPVEISVEPAVPATFELSIEQALQPVELAVEESVGQFITQPMPEQIPEMGLLLQQLQQPQQPPVELALEQALLPLPPPVRTRTKTQQAPKVEVEDAIWALMQEVRALERSDFDGGIRQSLHAIMTNNGMPGLTSAMEVLRGAIEDKKRPDLDCWPAYMHKVVKRYMVVHRVPSTKERHGRRHRRGNQQPHQEQDGNTPDTPGAAASGNTAPATGVSAWLDFGVPAGMVLQ